MKIAAAPKMLKSVAARTGGQMRGFELRAFRGFRGLRGFMCKSLLTLPAGKTWRLRPVENGSSSIRIVYGGVKRRIGFSGPLWPPWSDSRSSEFLPIVVHRHHPTHRARRGPV